ncbi:hypothetical protein BBP40_008532 [Aspergillus hancockii]|nr:hypothetical protein BBP40_008532 [Aspergillus hancockii]
MVSYRLEQASTGRAGCQNKECKDQKIKIAKGELRLGSWVDTDRIQAFFWRHWGCVTPKIISNLVELVGEDEEKDYEQIDGFEDLSQESQEKIKKALDQGHVDDEEWKGDVEMNRPGKVGFRKRVSKKQAAAEDSESEEKSPEPKAKKRGRQSTKEEADDQVEEAPEAKKTKRATRGKRGSDAGQATKEEIDDGMAAQPKPKATKKGRTFEKETEDKEPPKAPAKAATKPAVKRQRKAATEDDEAEAEPVEEKPKRGRRKKTAA